MVENACEKCACFFGVRSLYTLWAMQQKSPFISNCRVDADFLKAIDWKWHSWGAGEEASMETVDSYFHRPPAVSCIAAWPWRGGRGPTLHMVFFIGFKRQCCHSCVCLSAQFGEVSFQKSNENSRRILGAHMPQFALIAITGIPHHLVSSSEYDTIDRQY